MNAMIMAITNDLGYYGDRDICCEGCVHDGGSYVARGVPSE